MLGINDGNEKQGSTSPVTTLTLILECWDTENVTMPYGGHGSMFVGGMFSWKTSGPQYILKKV